MASITTPVFRVSFPSVFTPSKGMPGEEDKEKKYEITMLFTKEALAMDKARCGGSGTLKVLTDEIKRVIAEKWPKGAPKGLKICLRDGAEKEDMDGYNADEKFAAARSKVKPVVVDQGMKVLKDEDKFYAGCYARASVNVWAQDNGFGKRINLSLNNVQLIADGDPFSSRSKVEDDFKPIESPVSDFNSDDDFDFGDDL